MRLRHRAADAAPGTGTVPGLDSKFEPGAAAARAAADRSTARPSGREASLINRHDPLHPPIHPPSVCLFTDSLDPSGVGEHMLLLARQLAPTRRVWFAGPRAEKSEAFLERARRAGIQVAAFDLDERGLLCPRQLREWLGREKPDVFHAHAGISWEGHEAIYEARQAGCAVVRTEHLPYLLTDAGQIREHARLLEAVDRLICVSHAARDSFLEHGVGADRVRAVRNGITPRVAHADPNEARRALLSELGLPPQAALFLTVGRFTEQKGHTFLLEALQILDALPTPSSQVRLLWAGQGEAREDLQRRAREAGLHERVLFLGGRADVPGLMRACDAFVLPSLFEGLPLAALEAMDAGLPVVGTRVCGTEEVIESEEFGWLVPPRDPHALAHALAQVLASPVEAARRANNARARFEQEFGAERMARETAAVYDEALAERGRRAR